LLAPKYKNKLRKGIGGIMKNDIFNRRASVYTVFVIMFLLFSASASAQLNPGWANLKYAVYFTSGDVERLLADSAAFERTINYFAPVKPFKVYLEGSSRGVIDVEMLKKLRDKFLSLGIKVSGSMVAGSAHGGTSTYNNQEDMDMLKKRMQSLAQVFDNIILDDWLFTISTDEKSVEDRGNLSWADYRTQLILKQSKKYIIDAAKEVNPNAKIIIKYPNWYECHRQNGYDVYNETLQFDNMAVGIETRDPETQDQHIPIYSGYIYQKWFASVDPSKWVGAWLDNYDMKGSDNNYAAQVWQAIMAQSPEIILWCAGQLYSDNPSSDVYPHFKDMLPEFNKTAGLLNGSARGVPIYLPYGSTGEFNIFGYLGMAGIPLTPVAQFPTESQNAIFTLHSLPDPKLADEMLNRLRNGHDVFMTWGLLQKLQDTEFGKAFEFVNYGGSVTSSSFRVREGWFRDQTVKADRSFTFPRIQTVTWPGVRNVALIQEDFDYGILLETPYLKGNIYVLNMPDNYNDLLKLPSDALNSIRRAFNKDLGVEFDGPGGVGCYLFGQKQYVLYNMSDKAAPVSLRFTGKTPTEGWKELVHDKLLSVKQDTTFKRFGGFQFTDVFYTLQPNEMTIVQAP
jgi:hypothetical protein